MRRVIIESPYKAKSRNWLVSIWQRWQNRLYARAALLDCLHRDEAPLASHLLYPQVLDDAFDDERALGIAAGLEWTWKADAVVVYDDRGISSGMQTGIDQANAAMIPVEVRSLYEWSNSRCR